MRLNGSTGPALSWDVAFEDRRTHRPENDATRNLRRFQGLDGTVHARPHSSLDAFVRWERGRKDYHHLETLPWPPHDPPDIGEPYTQAEVLEYARFLSELIEPGVGRLDLAAEQCGFGWYDMPKLDHQLMNIRHLQHHVGDLAGRLRAAGVDPALTWLGRG